MSNKIDVHHTPVELSEQELDNVAGGIDIFLSGSIFEKSDVFVGNNSGSGLNGSGTNSVFQSSHTFSSAFQFIGLGFESMGDVMKVLKGLARLFGRR
ncbi:CTB family bacteriocin [Scytonema sp. NUACC21]